MKQSARCCPFANVIPLWSFPSEAKESAVRSGTEAYEDALDPSKPLDRHDILDLRGKEKKPVIQPVFSTLDLVLRLYLSRLF